MEKIKIRDYKEFKYQDASVLLRLDINSPLDPDTKKITDRTRIVKSLPTLNYLLEHGAKVAILAHQGDTLDYQNLISLEEHARILNEESTGKVNYIDDVAGPAAQDAIKALKPGEAILLGNVRYLAEEISTFEKVVNLTPEQMTKTWLVRNLAPLFDYYVNDAFSAAHRNCPSMVAFEEVLPSAAGELFFKEYSVLSKILNHPVKPLAFILGGAKISDAFGMLDQVLSNNIADYVLTSGVTGIVFLLASGKKVGKKYEAWLSERNLLEFVEQAKPYLEKYKNRILMPLDLAYEKSGKRAEIMAEDLPLDEAMFLDIGEKTIAAYGKIIADVGSMFINGPPGVYENPLFAKGTEEIWKAIANADGYSVVGGGDSVQAAGKFISLDDLSYVCTAGGAMVRFMTGKKLPLIEAMEKASQKSK